MRPWSAAASTGADLVPSSFADDRLFYNVRGNLEAMHRAKIASDRFDHASAFQCRARKCSIGSWHRSKSVPEG